MPSYTLLEPQPQGSMLDQGGNYPNTTYQDTNNYTEDDYIMFEDGAQILEAMESSSSMEQPLVSKEENQLFQ